MSTAKRLCLLVLIFALCATAQSYNANAFRVPDGSIVIDGKLDEDAWKHAPRIEITPANKIFTTPRSHFDGPKDCRAEFALLWDSTGFYVGTWFYDDIHKAPHCESIITAMGVHNDDGLEWWITINWDNAYADLSRPYFGDFGWQLGKGFNTTKDLVGKILHETGGFVEKDVSTPDDFTLKGFTEKYTSKDSVNFQSEAIFTWNGNCMSSKGTAKQGDSLGFNLGINDNDDGSGRANGNMRWTGTDVWVSPESWGRVTLAGPMTSK